MNLHATAAARWPAPVPRRLRFLALVLAYAALVALCLCTLWQAGELSLGRNPWSNLVKSVGEFSHPSFLDVWFGPERLEYRSGPNHTSTKLGCENSVAVLARLCHGLRPNDRSPADHRLARHSSTTAA